jgi:hypothetical protein
MEGMQMGFLKELKDAIKEGVAEGREEAAIEQKAEVEQAASDSIRTEKDRMDFIAGIPYDVRFGMCVAAPFRASAFMDWWTIFKHDTEVDEHFPKHLYTCAEPGLITAKDLKDLSELMERDFEIKDSASAMRIVGCMFRNARIPSILEFPEVDDTDVQGFADSRYALLAFGTTGEDERKDALCLLVSITAHAVAGSADLGYFSREDAVCMLCEIGIYTKSLLGRSSSFEAFGKRVLDGDAFFELNKRRGRRMLEKYVENLATRGNSPWKRTPWVLPGEQVPDFVDLVPPPGPQWLYDDEQIEAIEAHIEEHFGKFQNVFHELVSPDIHLDIAIVEPTEEKNYFTLVTMGMGAFLMNVPEGIEGRETLLRSELCICLPAEWPINSDAPNDYWPTGTLKAMGRYPIENETWFGWGHSIQFGEGFLQNDFLVYMLIHPLPDLQGSTCPLPDGETVNFYQLVPLTEAEMNFKREQGADALIERLEAEYGNDYVIVGIGRKPVV